MIRKYTNSTMTSRMHGLGVGCLLAAAMLPGCAGSGGGAAATMPPPSGGGSPLAITDAQAVWLDPTTIVWPGANPAGSYRLYYSVNANLAPTTAGVTGADNTGGDALTIGSLTSAQKSAFPQYASALALTVPAATGAKIGSVLDDQLVVVQYLNGVPSRATQMQTGPVLDAVYGAAATVPLGLSFDPSTDAPIFRLWAPTAQSVSLNVYASANATTASSLPMQFDAATGVWTYAAANSAWTNSAYYTFAVQVYSRVATANGSVVSNTVTDPYSVSLDANGRESMVANLDDAATKPAGWPGPLIATAAVPTGSVIYELHVRDFSSRDPTVPAADVGKYLAFTDTGSAGMGHLAALAQAGLTHVELLPTANFSSVDEAACTTPAITPTTGAGMQAEIDVINTQATSCYNWGYDPFHYGAPQGSYSSAPDDGLARVREFRAMIEALHGIGLRVIMDVVYPHTSNSGEDPHSVLDQIVPGYYYRLDANGAVENNSCCSDTAAERTMMAKLMIDTLKVWAGSYKVDGFRFDQMYLIPRAVMSAAASAVNQVTAQDGRGGAVIFGEGWTAPAQVATVLLPSSQLNLGGTGIGSFNDRLRDAVRGGGPADSGNALVAHQGFINGLCYDMNAADTAANPDCSGDASDALFTLQDRIRVGLAGNLADFPLRAGVTGSSIDYHGSPTGYTQLPQENIVYVSSHDNETLFDVSEYKQPASVSVADAARAQVVGLSLAVLAQGVTFIQGGDDLLRSKSGDSNSYRSEDYFNGIHWDGSTNNWAVGLPPQNTGNNAADAATLAPLLNAAPAPGAATILATSTAFQEFLKIRKDTDLFRMTSASAIDSCVSFPDATAQIHGLIVERILASGECTSTSGYSSVVVLFNASSAPQSYSIAAYAGLTKGTASGQVYLDPVQAGGGDTVLLGGWNFTSTATAGTFTVPARSTAVFVQYR